MRWRQWIGLAAVIGALILAGCSNHATSHMPAAAGLSSQLAVGETAQPFRLYTHCGIDEARIGHRYFEAIHPLSDGSGNPPAGWENPYQPGTMTQVSATEDLFRDAAGHRVLFRLRPGATSFQKLCS